MATELQKIQGCLAGLAVGDAMGRPTELLFNYRRIEKKYGRVQALVGRDAGAVTDDTRLTLTVADAIIEKGAMISADDLVAHWKHHPDFRWRKFLKSYNRNEGYWFGEHVVAFAGRLGVPGRYTGYLNASSLFAGNEAAMIMAPVGIVLRGRSEKACREGYALAHACIVGAGADMAGAWAAAISEALCREATVESVLEVARQSAPARIRTFIERALRVAAGFDDVFSSRPALYASCLKPIQVDSRETVPVALAMFMLAAGDPMTAAIGGANFGRDSDTIAGMAALLAGALSGIDAIDSGIYTRVSEVNGFDIEGYASRLADIGDR
jgi:ADP-ribosylglycohydrolase